MGKALKKGLNFNGLYAAKVRDFRKQNEQEVRL